MQVENEICNNVKISSKVKYFCKKIIKKFPIIKQINKRFLELENSLNEIKNILNSNTSLLNENRIVLNENAGVLHGNTSLLNENRIVLNENDILLKNIQLLNHEITYKLNVLFKMSSEQSSNELLSVLCDLYGSDKGSMFRDVHTYTKVYQNIFSPIRSNVKAVFECGIGRVNSSVPPNLCIFPNPGASLRVWRDYFANAVIIGGDINHENLFDDDRIHAGYIDQLSPLVIKRFFMYFASKYTDAFDIIIDNGLHTFEAAICLFENSFQYLKNGGLYIIEDMHTIKDIPQLKYYFGNCEMKDQITVSYKCLEKKSLKNDNNLVIVSKSCYNI